MTCYDINNNESWYSQIVSAIVSSPAEVDEFNHKSNTYELSSNYPNPFNPSTIIKYQIPQKSEVTIKIFSLLGQEVEILVNEEKDAGIYEVDFNAEDLPSGVYFYQLKAGSYVETKKMILLR